MKCLIVSLTALFLCGCTPQAPNPPVSPSLETTVPETTVPETTVPETTVQLHSAFYLENCPLEDLLVYWDEVVHQMEYTDGDASLVQKWLAPIRCRVYGDPSGEDLTVLEDLFTQLNAVEGFPGIRFAAEDELENLTVNFLEPDQFRTEFSDAVNGEDAWGATQFWYYTASNELYDGRIGIRTDIPQSARSSIIVEEIINTLGISDTELRTDSIVYQYSDDNLTLSDVDWLILKLLYHPDIGCGMDRDACHGILETLYR